MRIIASVRPRGLKRGGTTKGLFKSLGYKKVGDIDVRDVVGRLELNANTPGEFLTLSFIHQALGLYNPKKLVLKVFDADGNVLIESTPPTDETKEEEANGNEATA